MLCNRYRTYRPMCRLWVAIFWSALPTSSLARTRAFLWGRQDLLEELTPYKVRPAPESLPWCFETGTQSHEGIVGCGAAVDYFDAIGKSMASDYMSDWSTMTGRRQSVHAAMALLFDYEKVLAERLIGGLKSINGISVLGISDADAMDRRVPTVSFTAAGQHPDRIAEALAQRGIFVWSGHNYALEIVKALGIDTIGGAVRIGPVHYNSAAEIDITLNALEDVIQN